MQDAPNASRRPRIVVVGGGFAGLWAVRALARADADVVLVDRHNHHTFQPLLYQVATAGLAAPSIAAPLRHILRKQRNVTVQLGEVTRIDAAGKRVFVGERAQEFDYLLASGSEATIYLNDAYPIVLSESGQLLTPHAAQRDGITGYAPRQLVSRAPGLWQRLRISFKAPEFGADGSKRAPARLLRAELNGVLIHEDVPLVAAQGKTEQAKAPLRIVVNNGPIAFRNAGIATLRQRDQQRGGGPDPILVNAPTNTILRSFMDIPGTRVVHAVSVGHPQRVHYTYDLDHGNVVQVWRGGFLDATPMWHDRGNGTSRVLGSPIIFGKPRLAVAKLNGSDTPWPTDTSGTGYKPKGYTLDREERPTFRYQLYGASVEDAWTPLAEGHGFSRTVTVTGSTDNLYLQLAAAPSITDQGNGVYLVGDKRWYVQLQDTGKEKPVIRDQGEIKELLVPIRSVIRYSIIF